MGKVIKIAVGVILLGISAFYLLGVYLMITDAREDAAYNLSSSVRAEYLGSEYLGGRMELDGNEEQAEEGYGFYKLKFQLENVSSKVCFSGFDYLILIEGESYEEVNRKLVPSKYCPPDIIPAGAYGTTIPILPGKSQMELVYYVEVQEGVDQLTARYYPSWNEDEVIMELLLKE